MRWILLSLFVSISYAQVLEREDKPILKHSDFREIFHTSTSEGFFDVPYDFEVNSGVEVTYQYTNVSQLLLNRSAKIVVETVNATTSNPVLIVVRQKKDVMSWQHPLIVSTHAGVKAEYQKVSRTICPSKFYSLDAFEFTEDENLLVTASTSSPVNVTVRLTVEFVDDFYLSLSKEKEITVSPSQPSFYGYLFSNDTETIFLAVDSEDQACITVSLQNIDCPIYDLEKNVKFEGKWETMIHKGGMTLKIDRNQIGFFVVFVVNSYDDECSGLPGSGDQDHQSTLSFILTPGLSDEEYNHATITFPVVCFGSFYIIFILVMCYKHSCCCKCCPKDNGNERRISEERKTWEDTAIDLFQHASKKKSYFYFWITFSAAIFYFVPTVQRVVTHQLVLHETGNQDLCYYNFHCAHPAGVLSDFNHVLSNIGYILLGILFIIITASHSCLYKKQSSHADHHKNQKEYLNKKCIEATKKYREYKLPQHFGLFYAMGVALIAEGLLSGAYHICPRSSNFQFDTTFMYVIAMLCVVKIYKNQNREVYANATATFTFLGVVTFIVMLENILPSIWLSVIIYCCQLLISFVISLQLYYLGHISKGWNNNKTVFNLWRHGCCQCKCSTPENIWKLALLVFGWNNIKSVFYSDGRWQLKCRTPCKWVLPVLVNLLNWILFGCGVSGKIHGVATYVLFVFIFNLGLFFGFYLIKKYIHLCCPRCLDKIKQNIKTEEQAIRVENMNITNKNDQGESSTNPLPHQEINDEEGKEGEDFPSPTNRRKANETKKVKSEADLLLKKPPSDIAAGASSSHQTTESEYPGSSSGATNGSSDVTEIAIPEGTAGDRNTAESHSKKCSENVLCKCIEANIYLAFSAALWVAALYFYFSSSTSWEETPAISRDKNQGCIFLNFYDKHDLWHLLSAGALFFTFMVLLTLNDHHIETP